MKTANWIFFSGTNNYGVFYLSGLIYILISLIFDDQKRYFVDATITNEPAYTLAHYLPLKDSMASDTLFEVRSDSHIPISYFRKIATDVCFEDKCRLLVVNVYWNVTGRYLGLEFSEDEFLSKTDHEPFTLQEYKEMNRLLSDSLSLLANYDFEEIVVEDTAAQSEVDAVTSATLPAIKDYVIEGAAYTTLKLWHIIHGSSKSMIDSLTSEILSEELVSLIVSSSNSFDVAWILRKIMNRPEVTMPVKLAIGRNLETSYLMTQTILSNLPLRLIDQDFQDIFFNAFLNVDYNSRMLIVDYLKSIDNLNETNAMKLVNSMKEIQGGLFVAVLELLGQYSWSKEIYRSLANLLSLPNPYLSKKVFELLSEKDIDDDYVQKAMVSYQKKN